MNLTPADLREAALAVNQPPFTSNVVLAAKLCAEAERRERLDSDAFVERQFEADNR